MGYPRHYVGHYHNLAEWLQKHGHAVYPMEMFVKPVPVVMKDNHVHFLYGNVDVVSSANGKLFGWEYKSQNDSLKRGLAQLKNYARGFDFVCLASVCMPGGSLYDAYRDLGAGIYAELPGTEGFQRLDEPKPQKPETYLRDKYMARFQRNVYPNEHARIQRSLRTLEEREKFQNQHKLLTEFVPKS